MKPLAFLALLAFPLVAQDQSVPKPQDQNVPKQPSVPNISKLVEDLGNDDFTIRETATKMLIELGEPIISELQKFEQSSDSEVTSRVHKIIGSILRNKELIKYYNPCKPITMEYSGKADGLLNKLAELVGLKFSHAIDDRNIVVSFKDATVLQVLDTLCYKLHDVRWKIADKTVEFIKEWDAYESPAFYSGPFKISVSRIDTFKTTYFKNNVGGLVLHLVSQTDHTTKASDTVDFTIQEVMDETGNQIVENPTDPDQILLMYLVARLRPAFEFEKTFAMTGLAKEAKKLKKIRGTVGYYFPLITKKVSMEGLNNGQKLDMDAFNVTVIALGSNNVKFSISKDLGPTTMDRHFSVETLTLTDKSGVRWSATSNGSIAVDITSGSAITCTYYWYNGQEPTKLEFDLTTEYHYIQMPFEINNVILP